MTREAARTTGETRILSTHTTTNARTTTATLHTARLALCGLTGALITLGSCVAETELDDPAADMQVGQVLASQDLALFSFIGIGFLLPL